MLSLVGRHLVWPLPVLARVRGFLNQRCKGNPQWKGHEQLSDDAFVQRHGPWRGPYEEGTLFFYIDEYIKDAPKDLLAVLAATCEALARRLKKESTLVEKNIDALAGLLQLNRPSARGDVRNPARYQRDFAAARRVQGQQRAGSLRPLASVAASGRRPAGARAGRGRRIGMIENLISRRKPLAMVRASSSCAGLIVIPAPAK